MRAGRADRCRPTTTTGRYSMAISWRRPALAAVFALTASLGVILVSAPAQAQTVASGSLTFSGDPGDFITLGGSFAYSISAGDSLTVSGSDTNRTVEVDVSRANGDFWFLDLAAPDGQALQPGTYTGATRFPFNGAG